MIGVGRPLILFFLLVFITNATAQTLFLEDFESETDGATNGIATGTPGGTWSTNSSGGIFAVQNNTLRINNTSSEAVWTTNVVDISSVGYAVLNASFFSIGLMSDNDYVRMYYILDNSGVEIQFGEFVPFYLGGETQASAVVSGDALQIVIRAFDDSPDIFGLGFMQIDNVIVTAADVLYSRKSGTWTDMTGGFGGTGTWATSRTGNPPACGCVPLNNVIAVIRSGHTVTLPSSQTAVGNAGTANLAPGGVDVESGATLQFNVSNVTLGVKQGLVRVRNGGTVSSSSPTIIGEAIAFDADVGGATLQVDVGGTFSVEDLVMADEASNLHYLNGGGAVNVTDDIIFNVGNGTLTNNLSSGLSVGDRISFSPGLSGSRFINNQTVTATRLHFEGTNHHVTNNGTMHLQDIMVNDENDDNNTLDNRGSLNLNSTTTSIDPNGSSLRISNSGTIIQRGNFGNANGDLVASADIRNMATGLWEWRANSNTIYTGFADAIDFSTPGNTVVYSGTANQNIATVSYHNLFLSSGGTKTASGVLDVNGNLTIEASTIGTAGSNLIDVEGNVQINGSGILGGTGGVNLAGNWLANDASSFTEGFRTVTFDGAGTQTITNNSGTESFYSLNINTTGASNTVRLQNDVQVSQTLSLSRGRLSLNGNSLNITRAVAAAISGGSESSFIMSETTASPYSRLARAVNGAGLYVYPFGNSFGNYIPYEFNRTSGTGTLSVATYPTASNNRPYPATVTHVADVNGVDQSSGVVNRFWMVDKLSGNVIGSQNLRWGPAEQDNASVNRVAQRWNGTNAWQAPSAVDDSQPFTIASSSLASSSIWAVAITAGTLPVEWLDFGVKLLNHEVLITWRTATEKNNDYFTVERTQNLESFEKLESVRGKGDASGVNEYQVIDRNPPYGTTYYRISQTDFDGTVSYSNIKIVKYGGPAFPALQAYPSPCDGKTINVRVAGLKEQKEVTLDLIDTQGRAVFRANLMVSMPGVLHETVTFPEQLPAGVYILKAGPTTQLTTKIVVK